MAQSRRKRILVAVDGSEQAFQAVRYVSQIVQSRPFNVVLFHVMTRVPESFWDLEREPSYNYRIVNINDWENQQKLLIDHFMTEAQRVLTEAGVPKEAVIVKIQERREGIARDIAAESQNGYDAIVVGRRGLSELKDLVLGSIANKLIEKLVHVPLWIVGGAPTKKKLLLCVDASEGAQKVVEYVADLLQDASDVEITLFNAIRGYNVFQQAFGKSMMSTFEQDWMAKADEELERSEREVELTFNTAKNRLLKAGLSPDWVTHKSAKGVSSRAGAIIEEATQGDYDTIVIGRRGMSKIQEFFMGRVSNKVIQLARDKAVWVVS